MSEKKEAQQMTVELIGDERECLEYIEHLKQEYNKKEPKLIKILLILISILFFIITALAIASIYYKDFLLKHLSVAQTSATQTFYVFFSCFLFLLFCGICHITTNPSTEQEYINEKMGGNFEALCNASQSKRIRSVTFNSTNDPERTDISFCIEQDNKFVTYEIFKNVRTLATSDENNKNKVYIEFTPGVENLKIYRYCDETLPVGEVLKVV